MYSLQPLKIATFQWSPLIFFYYTSFPLKVQILCTSLFRQVFLELFEKNQQSVTREFIRILCTSIINIMFGENNSFWTKLTPNLFYCLLLNNCMIQEQWSTNYFHKLFTIPWFFCTFFLRFWPRDINNHVHAIGSRWLLGHEVNYNVRYTVLQKICWTL